MSKSSQEYYKIHENDDMDDGDNDYRYDHWKDRQMEEDPAYQEWAETQQQQDQQQQDAEMNQPEGV